MRCREHRADFSSSVGVCASCLRERLVVVIAEQEHQAQVLPQNPPPLLFPRSVSPYVARRKSQCDHPDWSPPRMSYPTPPVGFSGPHSRRVPSDLSQLDGKTKRRFLPFNLLRPRSEKLNPDRPRTSKSWFSSVFSFRLRSGSSEGQGSRRRVNSIERGMSPVIGPSLDAECSPCSGNAGYAYKTTPSGGRPGRNCHSPSHPPPSSAGLGLCLSPLVWTSPHHHRPSHHVNGLTESGARLRNESTFGGNRSRKLFDIGRR